DPGQELRSGQAAAPSRCRAAAPGAPSRTRAGDALMEDKELDELFTDPAHQEVVDLLKASRPATPPLDPNFRLHLRAQLMAEARKTLTPRAARSWFPFTFTPRLLAPAMAAVAAGFIVVLGIEVYLANQPATSSLVAMDVSKLNNKTNVATGE